MAPLLQTSAPPQPALRDPHGPCTKWEEVNMNSGEMPESEGDMGSPLW